MSATAAGLVSMEWARADGSIGTFFGVHSNLAMQSIAHARLRGAEGALAAGRWRDLDAIGAFALTEPDHGSDAVRAGDDARGATATTASSTARKRWIGNASIADVVIVWARDEDGHVGGYLVEKGTPGFDATRDDRQDRAARRLAGRHRRCDGVRVPAENRLPGCRTFRDVARRADAHALHGRVARARAGARRLRGGAGLREGARAVRPPDRHLPARPGQAQPHAGRDHRDAAALPAPQSELARGRAADRRRWRRWRR